MSRVRLPPPKPKGTGESKHTSHTNRPADAAGKTYKIGKGKPDPKYAWKPGQCPNPKGRPKGSKNIKTLIKASQRKTVTVNKGGRPRKLTINEVGLHGLEQEVLRGSRSAFLTYLELQDRYQDRDELNTSMQALLSEDEAIIAYMLARKAHPQTDGE
jgi:hypothetical protein